MLNKKEYSIDGLNLITIREQAKVKDGMSGFIYTCTEDANITSSRGVSATIQDNSDINISFINLSKEDKCKLINILVKDTFKEESYEELSTRVSIAESDLKNITNKYIKLLNEVNGCE